VVVLQALVHHPLSVREWTGSSLKHYAVTDPGELLRHLDEIEVDRIQMLKHSI